MKYTLNLIRKRINYLTSYLFSTDLFSSGSTSVIHRSDTRIQRIEVLIAKSLFLGVREGLQHPGTGFYSFLDFLCGIMPFHNIALSVLIE